MTPGLAALAALLSCGLAFSGLDFLRKSLAGQVRPVPLLTFLTLGTAPLFAAWWLAQGAVPPGAGYWSPALGSVVLNLVANLAMLQAVRLSPLSLTIPLLSLTPVFTALLAVPLLGERLLPPASLGIGAVVAGALALNAAGQGGRSPRELLRAVGREPGSLLMVSVALLWSLAIPLDKMALGRCSPAFHGLVLNAGVGLGAVLLLAARGRTAELAAFRRHGPLLALTIVTSAAALALQLVAMTLISVGVVETLKRAIGNLMAVAVGALAFGERVTAAKVAAIVLMAAGVALILLARDVTAWLGATGVP